MAISAKACPCYSGRSYATCCGRFIEKQRVPHTPEQLMRSRYTAFTQVNMDYLSATMRDPAAHKFNQKEAMLWAQSVTWLRLDVHQARKLSSSEGTVSFTVYFREQEIISSMHEHSLFHKVDRRWYYVDAL